MKAKQTLAKLQKSGFNQKEIAEYLGVSVRTVQRWKSQDTPEKTPLKKSVDKLNATGELIKYKRKKESIEPILEDAKDETITSKKSKNRSKTYLIVEISGVWDVQEMRDNKDVVVNLRETIKKSWKKFRINYRFLYLYGEIYEIGDIDNETTDDEYGTLIAKAITKTDQSERIEIILSNFIGKIFELYARYDVKTELQNVSIHFLNILR